MQVTAIQAPVPDKAPDPRRDPKLVLVGRRNDDSPNRLRAVVHFKGGKALIVLAIGLAKHLEGLGRGDQASQREGVHGLDLGNSVQAEVGQPLPGSSFQGRKGAKGERGQKRALGSMLDQPDLIFCLRCQPRGREAEAEASVGLPADLAVKVPPDPLSGIQFRPMQPLGATEIQEPLAEAAKTTERAVGQELMRQGGAGIHPSGRHRVEDD